MPNGDAAADAGMDTVPGTADLRDSYDEHNKTRDYIADHQTSGTHPASAINSGVFAEARIPAITDPAKIPDLPASKINSGTITRGVDTSDAVIGGYVRATSGLRCTPAYSEILTTDYRALYVQGTTGNIGHVPSSRRFKRHVRPAAIDPAAVLALEPKSFEYIAKLGGGADVGLIAEEAADVGLEFLVSRDEDGNVSSLHYERLSVALLAVVRDLSARLDDLTAKIEGRDR